jgi:hypothetical protein
MKLKNYVPRGGILSAPLAVLVILMFAQAWAKASPAVLIPTNAVWRYLDNGSDQGTFWREPFDYDDGDWYEGPAELGYGDAPEGRPEATVIGYGPDPLNRYITTYFRHHFQAANVADVTNLIVRLMRDDGGIVYLNGTEIFRSNMTDEEVNYLTVAETGVGDTNEFTFFAQSVAPGLLNEGENVMAVEIHQSRPDSSDLSFSLELLAENGPPPLPHIIRGPYLQSGTPSSIVVRWRTDQPMASLVAYGTDPNHLHLLSGDLDSATEHEVRITGLSPATKFYYSIESFDDNLAGGPDYYFITHPVPGRPKPTRIWAIGDAGSYGLGQGNALGVRNAYYNYAGSRETDVWLALGDNAYNVGADHEYQRAVFDFYTALLRKTVFWATIGNHETYTPLPNGRFPFLDIVTQPVNGEAGGIASGTERYYSFNYANIHFVCLDSMTQSRLPGSPMLTWLEQDLAANTNDWLIAFFHHPPYTKGSHDSDWEIELVQMRQYALPLLESYGVDLVLSGHSHIYERSFLLNGHYGNSSTLSPEMVVDSGSGRPSDTGAYLKPSTGPAANQGTVYVVAGSSGWATFRVGHHPAMFSDQLEMGSLVIDVNTNRLDAVFLRDTGVIDDSFSILKGTAADPFRLATFQVQNGKTIARWKSVRGHTYRVESTPNLESPQWQPISADILASGLTTSWTNAAPQGISRAFYRVTQVAGQ